MAFLFGKASSSANNTVVPPTPIAHVAAASVAQWRKNRQAFLQTWISKYVKGQIVGEILRVAQNGETQFKFTDLMLWDDVHLGGATSDIKTQGRPSLDEWQGTGAGAWLQTGLIAMLIKQLEAEQFNVQVELDIDYANDEEKVIKSYNIITFIVTWPNQPPTPAPAPVGAVSAPADAAPVEGSGGSTETSSPTL